MNGLLFMIITVVSALRGSLCEEEKCKVDLRLILNNNNYKQHVNKTVDCSDKKCVAKCCRMGHVHYSPNGNCTAIDEIYKDHPEIQPEKFDYKDMKIYKLNLFNDLELTNKSFEDFKIVLNALIHNADDRECTSGISDASEAKYALLEDGTLVREYPNFYNRFHTHDVEDFCVEYYIIVEHGKTRITMSAQVTFRTPPTSALPVEVISTGFLLSSIFLLLLLVIYGSLRELRNISGLVLMAFAATLILLFIIRAGMFLGRINGIEHEPQCKMLTPVVYYFTLSSFLWMNNLSYEMWRAICTRRPQQRRRVPLIDKVLTLRWFFLYAWGTPLLLTAVVTGLDLMDLSNHPNIIKPHFEQCLIISPETRIYLHTPLGVIIGVNWVFFIMTAYFLYKNNNSKRRNNFIHYLRLSLVTGLGWVFEIVPLPPWLQYIADPYNSLMGVFIFCIFCLKKQIFNKLSSRYRGNSEPVKKDSSTHITNEQI